MTGPEHYHEAELLLAAVEKTCTNLDETNPAATLLIAEAQVHATLATIPEATPSLPSGDDLLALLVDSLASFQATAQLSSLQHPQMRGHLAEHLADSLATAGLATGRTL